jgi:hypothetical protein
MKPDRPRRPRLRSRKRYVGSIVVTPDAGGDRGQLHVKRGCYRLTIDSIGDEVSDVFEPQAALWANIGDEIMLLGPSVDDDAIAIAEIVHVGSDGRSFGVRMVRHTMATGAVWIWPMQGLKEKRSRGKAA